MCHREPGWLGRARGDGTALQSSMDLTQDIIVIALEW